MNVLALSERKRIFLKTKKADLNHCENWRVSLVQISTNIPECASEVIGENACEISSLKVSNTPPLAPVPFRAFFAHAAHSLCHYGSPFTSPNHKISHINPAQCFIKKVLHRVNTAHAAHSLYHYGSPCTSPNH